MQSRHTGLRLQEAKFQVNGSRRKNRRTFTAVQVNVRGKNKIIRKVRQRDQLPRKIVDVTSFNALKQRLAIVCQGWFRLNSCTMMFCV